MIESILSSLEFFMEGGILLFILFLKKGSHFIGELKLVGVDFDFHLFLYVGFDLVFELVEFLSV